MATGMGGADEAPVGPRAFLHRVLKGKDNRPTRFHDESGRLVGLSALPNLPLAFWSTALLRLTGRRPERPWISYRAARHIAGLADGAWTVIEFGSGMSTLWLARLCGQVHSVESDGGWSRLVQDRLAAHALTNVTLHLREPDAYADLSTFPDAHFDFALVDGIRRADCCRDLVRTIKPGGWVYLDNADRAGATPPSGDLAEAKAILTRAAEERGGTCTSFVDFVPTSLVVSEGLLFRL